MRRLTSEKKQKLVEGLTSNERFDVGPNPFDKKPVRINVVQSNIEGIISVNSLYDDRRRETYKAKNQRLISELSWDPVILKSGKYVKYQRPFVWTKDEQDNLLDSIYNDISCGLILIRKRSWKDIDAIAEDSEIVPAFKDIVDGKQRLNCLSEFINCRITDRYGNYYSDLSDAAQMRFLNSSSFTYGELDESVTDQDTVRQFLKTNFTGVPQSIEHIEYVKSLLK